MDLYLRALMCVKPPQTEHRYIASQLSSGLSICTVTISVHVQKLLKSGCRGIAFPEMSISRLCASSDCNRFILNPGQMPRHIEDLNARENTMRIPSNSSMNPGRSMGLGCSLREMGG